MQLQLKAPTIALETGQVVTLDDARGTRIVTRVGTVWVTEEGDTRDHVVGPVLLWAARRDSRAFPAGRALEPQMFVDRRNWA